jgi:hypothetical protein
LSWTGYIPGDLVRELWEKEPMNDQTGMNTFSESQNPCRDVVNVPADKSALSSYEIEESLRLATMELQKATEAAWKVRVREDSRMLIRGAVTTPDREAVSPFMQRLMLYCGLLALNVQELRSIVPTGPATAVTGSSKEQESSSSSPQIQSFFSRSSNFMKCQEEIYKGEPPIGSIVLDDSDDAWQRNYNGWTCAYVSDSDYKDWSWEKLSNRYALRLIYRNSRT